MTDITSKYANLGYDIRSIELDGSVYELQARTSSGFPAELHVDATTGERVASNDDDVDEVDDDSDSDSDD